MQVNLIPEQFLYLVRSSAEQIIETATTEMPLMYKMEAIQVQVEDLHRLCEDWMKKSNEMK